jgi:succinoglycan biosynthesis protein ExoA
MEELPFVSIIMPVRNEAGRIEGTLRSVLVQDYPPELLEVIVANGMSTDRTMEIIQSFQERHANLYAIDNTGKIVSTGLNAALSQARGEVIIRVDGHCEVANDFVRECVSILNQHPEAWSVGGPIVHEGSSLFGKAAAAAMSHPFAVGNAYHRFSKYEGYGEGAAFPTFRRWVFDRVGTFDERLLRNQDDEFNYRIAQAGGKIYISPRIKYVYFVREHIGQLFRQYFQYAFWRILVIKIHHKPTTFRQLVPPLFFLVLLSLFITGMCLNKLVIALALPVGYLAMLLAISVALCLQINVKIAFLVPVAILTIHLAYAFGFIYGLLLSFMRPTAWEDERHKAKVTR